MISTDIKYRVAEIIAALFIVLFIYASISKLLSYEDFSVQLSNSPILTKISGIIIWLVPALEILLAIVLAIPRFRLYGLYGSLTLMTIFTAYIIAILQFSYTIPCSCGGVLSKLTWQTHLVFNIGFLILSAAGIIIYPGKGEAENLYKRVGITEH
jgi:uncharacterized membrane protein YphA (DoxX/SURF4 family)